MKIISSLSLAAILAVTLPYIPAHAADPDFGPNVLIFDPTTPNIETTVGAISSQLTDENKDQFSDLRYAFLFKPGNYGNVNLNVGYYMQMLGLGQTPDAVMFTGRGPHSSQYGMITQTFWRSVENFAVNNTSEYYWGVSQGADMRRIDVPGNKLSIFSGGYASGGFTADCRVSGLVGAYGQQQWISRNSDIGTWDGGAWSIVFVGVPHLDRLLPGPKGPRPPRKPKNDPNQPATPTPPPTPAPTPSQGQPIKWPIDTGIEKTPLMAEKPYLYIDNSGHYFVMVPALQKDSVGTTWANGPTPGKPIPIEQFYLARADKGRTDTAATINAALAAGKNVILCPGIYHLEDSIKITRADTVVLGIGYPTLIPDKGVPAMKVANVNGVKIGTLLLQASTTDCPTMLQVGDPGDTADRSADPTIIYDIFARVGGAGNGAADCMVVINSNNVIGDNAWLWRADHGAGNGWNDSKVKNGLIVNGNNVIYYGLAVEHTQEYQTIWNGNGGRVYFYQSEMPYDIPTGVKAWASYKVSPNVTTHEAYGVGVYSFNHPANGAVADNAFEAPSAPGVKFTHLTMFKAGAGGIQHMINGVGPSAMANGTQHMDSWP